jgi:CrcB protein
MNEPSIWLAVGTGGAAGAILRGLIFRTVELWGERESGGRWSDFGAARSTLIVNVVGSFVLGCVVAGLEVPDGQASDPLLAFWVTGVCGAITTFSTLCADAMSLARSRGRRHMAVVLLANALFGIAALLLGIAVGR